MSDPSMSASPLFLREAEVRRGIELLYFGHAHLTGSIEERLTTMDLGRAHHRALYFIARSPGLTIGDLLRLLRVTKQSLGRVLTELIDRQLVSAQPGSVDRRQKSLRLTAKGTEVEKQLFEDLRAHMATAYQRAGQGAVTGYWSVLEGLIPPDERARISRFQSR